MRLRHRRQTSIFEVFRDANSEWRWRLLDNDRSVIMRSPRTFPTAAEAETDIRATKRQIADSAARPV